MPATANNVLKAPPISGEGLGRGFSATEFNIYGSSRIGMVTQPEELDESPSGPVAFSQTLGYKVYEFSNHLGNVLTTFSDRKIPTEGDPGLVAYYTSEILSSTDYYPFGFQMPGRVYEADGYRYGFNSMEKDDELKGSGNSYDFGARIYDPRVGRWLAVDPLAEKYPNFSSYHFVANCPLIFIDPDGKKIKGVKYNAKTGEIKYSRSAIKRGTDKYISARMMTENGKSEILAMIIADEKVKITVTDKILLDFSKDDNGKVWFTIIKGFTSPDGKDIVVSSANFNYDDVKQNPELLNEVSILNESGDLVEWEKLPLEQVKNPYDNPDIGSSPSYQAWNESGRAEYEDQNPWSKATKEETISAVGAHEETHWWDIIKKIPYDEKQSELKAMINEVRTRIEFKSKNTQTHQ